MHKNATLEYFYGEKNIQVKPIGDAKINNVKNLPNKFLIKDKGIYEYENESWALNEEGLYRFYCHGEFAKQHCYYKYDTYALVTALFHCCEYSGTTLDVDNYYLLDDLLVKRNEINLPLLQLLFTMLSGYLAAVRHVGLYSPVIDGSILDWVEVWSEKLQSWELYCVDNYSYLGKTNKLNTCFDVFNGLIENKKKFELMTAKEPVLNETVIDAGIEEEVRKALVDNNGFAELVQKYKLFPVVRASGMEMLKATSSSKYKELIGEKQQIKVGLKTDLLYALELFDDEHIRNFVYGPQTYIVEGKAVRIN